MPKYRIHSGPVRDTDRQVAILLLWKKCSWF